MIRVDEPMAIVFFPRFDSTTPGDGVESAVDHLSVVVDVMETCLEAKGVLVEWVETSSLVVENRGRKDRLDLSADSPGNASERLGCYLASPGRPPSIARGSTGPSSLIVLCPAAASTYFDVPECCPDGFRCCSDGSVATEATSCGSR